MENSRKASGMHRKQNLSVDRFSGVLFLLVASIAGCATTYARRDPTGELFPTVIGRSLDERAFSIPGDLSGEEALLLVGYRMKTQFDIDRWLLALHNAGVEVPTYELPTIPGLVPGLFAGSINEGMRSGIPREDWAVVITIYDDAKKIAEYLGNENALPARVVLLDGNGRVAFFHDNGYSLGSLLRLKGVLESLRAKASLKKSGNT